MEARSLLNQLQRKHESRKIVPWGSVVVVPARNWKPEWTSKLHSEGCKIFKEFHNGSTRYLIKHDGKAVPKRKPKPKPQQLNKTNQTRKGVLTLSEPVKNRLEALGKFVVCYRCGEPLKIGDKLVTRKGCSPSSFKMYHRSCWESMFIEA